MPSVTTFAPGMTYVLSRPEKQSAWCPQIPGRKKRNSTLKHVCACLMRRLHDKGNVKREGHGLRRLSETGPGRNSTRGAVQILIDTKALIYSAESVSALHAKSGLNSRTQRVPSIETDKHLQAEISIHPGQNIIHHDTVTPRELLDSSYRKRLCYIEEPEKKKADCKVKWIRRYEKHAHQKSAYLVNHDLRRIFSFKNRHTTASCYKRDKDQSQRECRIKNRAACEAEQVHDPYRSKSPGGSRGSGHVSHPEKGRENNAYPVYQG